MYGLIKNIIDSFSKVLNILSTFLLFALCLNFAFATPSFCEHRYESCSYADLEILEETSFKVVENDLGNCCQNKKNFVAYRDWRTGVEVAAAKTGTTVLGKYPDYINLAGELGAKRFNIPTNIWNKMTAAEQWAANTKFLDRMIARGDKIVLSNRVTDINKVTGAFRKELDYLMGKGYRLSSDGLQMIK